MSYLKPGDTAEHKREVMSINIKNIKTGNVGESLITVGDGIDPDIEIDGCKLVIPDKYKNTEKQQAFIDGWAAGLSAGKEG